MLQSDARVQNSAPQERADGMDNININSISEIEKELRDSHYDLISLVFLLYDVPDTALQRLIIFQRVYKDVGVTNLELLQDWYRHAKSRSSWKFELLEALMTCQLYSIIRKLGFDVGTLKEKYQPDNIFCAVHLNPVKKALYKLCEHTNMDTLDKLKKSLLSYDIDTTEHEVCELVLLDLLCRKFITLNTAYYNNKVVNSECNLDSLVKIIEYLPSLKHFSGGLRNLQLSLSENIEKNSLPTSSIMSIKEHKDSTTHDAKQEIKTELSAQDFSETYKLFENLNLDEGTKILKSDTKIKNSYPIKDRNRLGVCLIINQDSFHPSRNSIEYDGQSTALDPRVGSEYDKIELEKTMTLLKFHVISRSNLNHTEMLQFIKDSIENWVTPNDSVFMLCIMSHGVRDHVYAADSVKVRVEDIQNYLDSDEAEKLHGIPKVFILQACQVNEEPQVSLVADSPKSRGYHLKKSDFLVYWATAPEFEAYRDERCGSIFIQTFCYKIKQLVDQEHLHDIMTVVNNKVTSICKRFKCNQVPIFISTLTKKLYFQIP